MYVVEVEPFTATHSHCQHHNPRPPGVLVTRPSRWFRNKALPPLHTSTPRPGVRRTRRYMDATTASPPRVQGRGPSSSPAPRWTCGDPSIKTNNISSTCTSARPYCCGHHCSSRTGEAGVEEWKGLE